MDLTVVGSGAEKRVTPIFLLGQEKEEFATRDNRLIVGWYEEI